MRRFPAPPATSTGWVTRTSAVGNFPVSRISAPRNWLSRALSGEVIDADASTVTLLLELRPSHHGLAGDLRGPAVHGQREPRRISSTR